MLIHDILKCDAVKILVYHLIQSLPDREHGTVRAARTNRRLLTGAGDGGEVALLEAQYLPDRQRLRRLGELVATLRAAFGFKDT